MANRVCWSDDQSADSGVGGSDGLADRIHWSDDQLADSGVGGLVGQPTVYIGVMISQPTVGLVG